VKGYNAHAVKEITFEIDTAYTGVAEASGAHVRYNPQWFRSHPGDIDVVTHEIMHIVQNYPGDAGPWWITEGIADYVRYVNGVDNAGGGWALPPYMEGQHYSNAFPGMDGKTGEARYSKDTRPRYAHSNLHGCYLATTNREKYRSAMEFLHRESDRCQELILNYSQYS
jgi:hypothetical protein